MPLSGLTWWGKGRVRPGNPAPTSTPAPFFQSQTSGKSRQGGTGAVCGRVFAGSWEFLPGCLQGPLGSVVVQSLSGVQLFATPWTAARQASLSFTISGSLLKLMSTESVMPSNHLILCYPLLLLPSVFPSIRVFSNELAFHFRLPKYWSFSFSISPSNEYSGLISFMIDWFDLGSSKF